MIPAPLVAPPARAVHTVRKVWWAGPWAGTLLLVGGVFGVLVWYLVLAPSGYKRFPATDTQRLMSFRQSGTYLVYEEYEGASRGGLPPAVTFSVRGRSGQQIPVEALAAPGSQVVQVYGMAGHEGRAVARFTIDEPGDYLFEFEPMPAGSYRIDQFAGPPKGEYAVGRDVRPFVLAGWLGLLVVGVLPTACGITVLVMTRSRRRAAAAPTSS